MLAAGRAAPGGASSQSQVYRQCPRPGRTASRPTWTTPAPRDSPWTAAVTAPTSTSRHTSERISSLSFCQSGYKSGLMSKHFLFDGNKYLQETKASIARKKKISEMNPKDPVHCHYPKNKDHDHDHDQHHED